MYLFHVASSHGIKVVEAEERCETYAFIDKNLAMGLASIAEQPWGPMALVDADLEQRRAAEEQLKTATTKAVLSKTMSDEEVKEMAVQGNCGCTWSSVAKTLSRSIIFDVAESVTRKYAIGVLFLATGRTKKLTRMRLRMRS
ncbi:unnamed protein product [Phytophthora lilii]|uniref:Unnamed protein product n=1 Tax=Phytophthora lilii TaxID=2077276 RepID=A0A9W6WQW8_9STRA|nr:unnamed protein product [Phytophthora lilii]